MDQGVELLVLFSIALRTGQDSQERHRDPVRSSHGHFVKASGLRWLSLSQCDLLHRPVRLPMAHASRASIRTMWLMVFHRPSSRHA
jgi:hypothetical protein